MVNSELHFEVLPEQQRLLCDILAEQSWMESFYLAGGTALALHIGHRQSIDFDFFTQQDFRTREIIKNISMFGTYELFSEAENTIHGLLNDVRISFFTYKYPIISAFHPYRYLKIADMLDIALMKFEAISGRGSRKVFIDLYFLLNFFSLNKLFQDYEVKYGIAVSNHYHLLKSLVYFTDAESEPMPVMYADVSWDVVKETIITEIRKTKLM